MFLTVGSCKDVKTTVGYNSSSIFAPVQGHYESFGRAEGVN